ncbi:cytochrome P450 [Armillaria mellea]|nr:cytochrome P450 [Armillaria mellea]
MSKQLVYKQTGWDIVACVTAFPARIEFLVADTTIIKDITASRALFPKPVSMFQRLSIFGPNVVTSEGDTWRKYQKIKLLKIMENLINTVWKNQDVVEVEHMVDVTLLIALKVIGMAGFGCKIDWQADTVIPERHTMSFHDTLNLASTGIVLKLGVPCWVMGLTPKWAKVRAAFDELEVTCLLDANNEEDGGGGIKLTDQELLGKFYISSGLHAMQLKLFFQGNIFIFLVAGHETTGHTLALTLTLLALYPDQQEILYHHIKSIVPDGWNPYLHIVKILPSAFYETLRLFPPVTIPKTSVEDTIFVSTNKAGECKTIPVPQGSIVRFDVVGLHHNSRYWKDPETFNLLRFLGDWPREAFMPFSQGAHACMGQKYILNSLSSTLLMTTHRFSETEGVAVLTTLILRYKFTVNGKPGETFEAKKERVLKMRMDITLT